MNDKTKLKEPGFNYVDITTKGCEGWLNLFFGEDVIALVSNAELADRIRATTPTKEETS